ncbi:GIY-YIG nuclease family protein [Pseudomonas sp. St29]|uniref:GIY-YIG nuclease family protein n=1 Tax=Pseudomonas sp. St29 TaxID=1500687 RepID=UPI0005FCC395|nr:GIY-YIG nuclease family protein [Pseudomonas sp. St29]BAQ79887.1 bacteriophage f237 ORF8 [Pseudomonas sp. St29]
MPNSNKDLPGALYTPGPPSSRSDWRMKACNGIAYVATNSANGKQYVGVTRRKLKERVSAHLDTARRGKGGPLSIWEAIRKYGIQAFNFYELARASTLGELSDIERDLISRLGSLAPDGYNQNRGGAVAPCGEVYFLEGREFWGLSEVADYYGLVEITVHVRVRAGWSLEQAAGITPPPKRTRSGKSFQVAGLTFPSEKSLCDYFGVDPCTFRQRVQWCNWGVDEALGLVERDNPHKLVLADQEYDGLADACRSLGKPLEKVRSRLASGWSHLEAFDLEPRAPLQQQPVVRSRRKDDFFPVLIAGEQFCSGVQIARHFGLEVATVSYRIRRSWTPEEVAGIRPREALSSRSKQVEVAGVHYPSMAIACRTLKVQLRTVNSRLRYGWSIEAAFGFKEHVVIQHVYVITHPDQSESVTHNLVDFCRTYGIPNQGNLALTIDTPGRRCFGYKARRASVEEVTRYVDRLRESPELEVVYENAPLA